MDEIPTKSELLSPMLPIRQIYSYNSKVCLILGFMLNLTVIWLVRYRTPKEMKVYSKIVLQTCFVDLILLVSSELVQPILIVSNGVAIILENGITTKMSAPWNVVLYNCWFFNSYFVSIGVVVQFIYRYLTLCRNIEIKTKAYFAMLAAAAAVEAILLGFFFWIGHPPKGARVKDTQVLRILGEPATGDDEPIPWHMRPTLYGDKSDTPWLCWIACFLAFGALCYGTIWFCGTQMVRFVRKNLKLGGTSLRVAEVNRQMVLNMCLQASIPMLDILVFMIAAYASVTENKSDWFVCLCLLLGPLVNWIPVLNPLATILTVGPYRKTLIRVGPSLPPGSTGMGQSRVFLRRASNWSSEQQQQQRNLQIDKISTIAQY